MFNIINLSIYNIINQFVSEEFRELTHSQRLFAQIVTPKYVNEAIKLNEEEDSYKTCLEQVKVFIDESVLRYNKSIIIIDNKLADVDEMDEEFKLVLIRFINVVKKSSKNIILLNDKFLFIPSWYERNMLDYMSSMFKPKKRKSFSLKLKELFGSQKNISFPIIRHQEH